MKKSFFAIASVVLCVVMFTSCNNKNEVNGENVDKIFTTIAENIYTNLIEEKDDSINNTASLVLKRKKQKEKKQCC